MRLTRNRHMQALSGWLLFKADGDDIAEGQIDEFSRRALMCERLIFDAPRVRPVLLGDPAFEHLRHTRASLAVMNGVPLMVVAKNLGHADTRMVEKQR
jgi:hypothetical protein